MSSADALPRSYLYVPAHQQARLALAHERGADAVIADLEDGVPPDRKQEAADVLLDWLSSLPAVGAALSQTWVRLDPVNWQTSVDLLAHPAVHGVVVPKAESRRKLDEIARALTRAESSKRGRRICLMPLIESARGLRAIDDLATASRVQRLGMGEADLVGELGLDPSTADASLTPARWEVVVASAAAGLAAPVGSTSTNYRDLDALSASTVHLRSLGYRARTAIHPAQLKVLNAVFTPTLDEVDRARSMIVASEAQGGGAVVGPDGQMVDDAVLRSAREVLARARSGRRI